MGSFFEVINLSADPKRKSRMGRAIALGMFDGVHLGHQALLKDVKTYADEHQLKACAITFREAPIKWTAPQTQIQLITSLEERLLLFQDCGIDEVIVFEFPELVRLEAKHYLHNILKDQLDTRFVTCGINHRFGRKQEGDFKFLSNWANENNVACRVFQPIKDKEDKVVSSSLIRQTLREGRLKEAIALLGYPVLCYQPLQQGQQQGRKLGYPTLNFSYPADKVSLPIGVYAAKTELNGSWFASAVNLGFAPTARQQMETPILESHILDFEPLMMPKVGDWIKIQLIEFIRPEKKFASLEDLKMQIAQDCDLVKRLIV